MIFTYKNVKRALISYMEGKQRELAKKMYPTSQMTSVSASFSNARETGVCFQLVWALSCLGFKGGNFGNTQLGESLSHSPTPVSLCLKSGPLAFLWNVQNETLPQ